METGSQESAVDRKMLTAVGVVLALILLCFCYVMFLLIRSRQTVKPAQQQLAQPEFPVPTSAIVATSAVVLPSPTVQSLATAVPPTAAAAVLSIPTSTLWRFISINAKDIGTFEAVGDPNHRLTARCLDIKRPAPKKGEIYTLDESGILKPQSGNKKFQRFEVIKRQ